jgi:hypothetical protein
MNSADEGEPRAAQVSGAVREKCFVCGKPVEGQGCCKIHREEGGPLIFCCPDCVIQYLDSTRNPDDARAHELQVYQDSVRFLVGEGEPRS